jgi:hypothetical protein
MKEDEQDRVRQRRRWKSITEHRIRNISIIRFDSRKGHALPLPIAEHECGIERWSLARQIAVPALAVSRGTAAST